jgi:hypothetical protein
MTSKINERETYRFHVGSLVELWVHCVSLCACHVIVLVTVLGL